MVSPNVTITHQRKRTQGSISGVKGVPVISPGKDSAGSFGQLDSPGVHQKTRRDSFFFPLPSSKGTTALGKPSQDYASDEVHSRETEYQSGPAESTSPGPSHGMDLGSKNMQETVEPLGHSHDRLVCLFQKSSPSSLLLSNPGPSGLGSGCHDSGLVTSSRLCLSPIQHDQEGGQ